MEKISVVIPVYGVEAYLPACLDSVLGQSLRDIEVLCVDDASPDRCGQILDEYARKDGRVRVFHLPENRRQGYGRNLGMDNARGRYVYFLDADDMIAPGALEELFALAEKDALQAVFFDSVVIYDNEQLERRYASYPAARRGTYPDAAVSGPELFDLFIRQNEWTCYVQRQLWDLAFLRRNGIRFPDGVEHEDELLPYEGLLLADRAKYVRRPYFIRRYREGSVLTVAPTAKNFHGYFMNLVLMDAFVRKHGIQSRAAEINMSRISQRVDEYYDLLKDREDLSAWFREGELPLYYFYRALWEGRETALRLRPGLKELLEGRSVYVYGAGALGSRAVRCLSANGVPIDGVVVSRPEGNPDVLHGHRVIPLEKLRADREKSVLVLAMTLGYRREVQPALEADGWTCVPFTE